jgi:site-specific DNA recombinase
VTEPGALRGAIYIRVSSAQQADRDFDPEGYSIPAQREACERELAKRGATKELEEVDRGETGTNARRPGLQRLLKRIEERRDIDLLVVHKVDRLARNRLDDALLYHQLTKMGITLVSASENIDDTPAGRLMHGMLATFAEYYSNNLATEIKKGLYQKHKLGGTPFRPPIGYRPVRKLVEGREVRTIELDPERAPLVKRAFELYAAGDWSLIRLTAHLRQEGLISRPTPKQGGRPLAVGTVHKVLKNPYYMGIVEYAGKRVLGRHDALVDGETFDRVQTLLAAARLGGERPSKHEHYLRGTIVCAECGGRLLFGRHRSKTGATYDYFSCNNRASRARGRVRCSTGYYAVGDVERRVEALYGTVRLPDSAMALVRQEVARDIAERTAIVRKEAAKHERRIEQIEANQAKLVQLYYRDLVSEDVLEREQDRLREEKEAATRLLDVASLTAGAVEGSLEAALAAAADPQGSYLTGTALERRVMNKTFFERIEVGADGDITDIRLTPVYRALKTWHPGLGRPPGRLSSPARVRPSSRPVHHLRKVQTLVPKKRTGPGFVLSAPWAAVRASWPVLRPSSGAGPGRPKEGCQAATAA